MHTTVGLNFLRPLFSHLQSDWFTILELCCDCLIDVKFLVEVDTFYAYRLEYTYLALHIIGLQEYQCEFKKTLAY